MKSISHIALILLLALSSCETAQYFAVETIVPAEFTFPVPSPRIVVVNNAVTQPEDKGVEYLAGSRPLKGYTLQKDSAHWTFINSLGDYLNEANFFEEVLVYNIATKEGEAFLSSLPIRQEKAEQIVDEVNADALLLTDRLLFNLSQQIIGTDSYFSSIEIVCEGTFSLYDGLKKKISPPLVLSDTLKFSNYVGYDTILFLKKIPEVLLMESARKMAEKVTERYAPHWRSSTRVYYAGSDSRMKTAFAYAKNNRVPEAIALWEEIYSTTESNKRKGMAAINIAVAQEMAIGYTPAIEWVEKALNAYSKEKPDKVKEERQFATAYKKELEQLRRNILRLP